MQPTDALQNKYRDPEWTSWTKILRRAGATSYIERSPGSQTNRFTQEHGLPGEIAPGDVLRRGYLLELALSDRPGSEALVIGLGGGLVPRILNAHGICWHAVELDPVIVKAAREAFALSLPPESVTVGDGRRFLADNPATFDFIIVDVCTADRLPAHLFTRESLALMRARLRPGGILAVQFVSDDGEFAASLRATAGSVFPRPVILRTRDPAPTPRWLFASATPLPPVEPGAPFDPLPETTGGQILTDDHFAAERAWTRTADAMAAELRVASVTVQGSVLTIDSADWVIGVTSGHKIPLKNPSGHVQRWNLSWFAPFWRAAPLRAPG